MIKIGKTAERVLPDRKDIMTAKKYARAGMKEKKIDTRTPVTKH